MTPRRPHRARPPLRSGSRKVPRAAFIDRRQQRPRTGSDALVFCTAAVGRGAQRYRDWVDYYREFFRGEKVDLLLVNDGPDRFEAEGATFIPLSPRLGRQSLLRFPGWKRSFAAALEYGRDRYRWMAHVESDLYVLERGKEEFLRHLRSPGYKTGFSSLYCFAETALQFFGQDVRVVDWLIRRYQTTRSLHEAVLMEDVVEKAFNPVRVMAGERSEGPHEAYSFSPTRHTYVAACPSRADLERILSRPAPTRVHYDAGALPPLPTGVPPAVLTMEMPTARPLHVLDLGGFVMPPEVMPTRVVRYSDDPRRDERFDLVLLGAVERVPLEQLRALVHDLGWLTDRLYVSGTPGPWQRLLHDTWDLVGTSGPTPYQLRRGQVGDRLALAFAPRWR